MLKGRLERSIQNMFDEEHTEIDIENMKKAIRINYIRGFISKEDRDYLYKLLK